MIDPASFKIYRSELGYSNQQLLKSYFAAKDIKPNIDGYYIEALTNRLKEILIKINSVLDSSIKLRKEELTNLLEEVDVFKLKLCTALGEEEALILRLNNQGRRPEEVYFSWMRGRYLAKIMKKFLINLFSLSDDNCIRDIGGDNLSSPEDFKRLATADYQVNIQGKVINIEVQCGFQGINDIKQHKFLEAHRLKQENSANWTYCVHYDFFNGIVSIVRLDLVDLNDMNFVSRPQMEGQMVYSIPLEEFYFTINKPVIPILNDPYLWRD